MQVSPIELRGTHRYSYRSGEWGRVMGVLMVRPSDPSEPRLAYQVCYGDGAIDYVAMVDSENYEIREKAC